LTDAAARTAPGPARMARLARDVLPYLGLAATVAFFALASEFFLDLYNLQRLVTDAATLLVVAMGMTLVILLGEIDLSVGAVAALLGVLLAQMMAAGLPWPAACAAALALAVAIGTLNGAVTVLGRIHSFVTTLGMSSVATGLAFVFTGAISVPIGDIGFLDLFYTVAVLGLPVPVLIVAACFAACLLALARTPFGRELFAVGASAEAARLSGVPVRRDKIAVFAIMGALVGVGAILGAARLGSGAPGAYPALTLDAIAAVIIGGASLFGGRASLVRSMTGALLIAVLNNGMALLNVNADAQYLAKGLIILAAVVLERAAALARA